VITTVAPTRFRLSGSETEAAFDRTTGTLPWVNCALAATPDRVGGSLTAVMLTV
jgi:hypothetical protein